MSTSLPFNSTEKGVPPKKAPFQLLNEDEIHAFFADIDKDGDGYVTFAELEDKLEQVHKEIAPEPKRHHLHHPHRRRIVGERHPEGDKTDEDIEANRSPSKYVEHDGLHAFLCSLLPDCGARLGRDEFIRHVKSWQIPSQSQTSSEDEDHEFAEYEHQLPIGRRLRAHWSVEGPKIIFVSTVISLVLGIAIWQMVKYIKNEQARAAFGWGVIVAKFSAGALYPVLALTILSMSRWFATFMRRFHHISRLIDWDRSQSFHIWMASIGLFFASLHAIGHLTGTFLYGSRAAQQANVAVWVGQGNVPKPYVGFVQTLPGWTGIASLGLYWSIALLSIPQIRRLSYEAFQLAHLLMFPMIGLLCAHGTMKILQDPMLGYWLALPTLLVIYERIHRLLRGGLSINARVKILDDDTVMITCMKRGGGSWKYEVGQYVFLQVPRISFFQWHPFTISSCQGELLQIHVKTDGDWTQKLRGLPTSEDIKVGIDGPFGAPSQRFYSFDRSLIIGAGVGITPFAAILNDLEQRMNGDMDDPWNPRSGRSSRRPSLADIGRRARSRASIISRKSSEGRQTRDSSPLGRPDRQPHAQQQLAGAQLRDRLDEDVDDGVSQATENEKSLTFAANVPPSRIPSRRVDFHWMVRDKNYLLWFSSLLNRVHDLSRSQKQGVANTIDLNIVPHVTARRRNISTHVFRYLLDRYRTPTSPQSALTGLKMTSNFGRPDLEGILQDFHVDMLNQGWRKGKVGVFFCGSPAIGRVLADTCAQLTARARMDGSKIRYIFMMEVFG